MVSGPTWREVVQRALDEQGVDALTRDALDALEREMPALRADDDLRQLARGSVAATLAVAVEMTRGSIGLDDYSPPPQAVAFARELAHRNVPMSELARSYRITQHVVWRFGVAELRRALGGDPALDVALERFTDAVFITGEALVDAALERYAVERDRWVRSADALRRATVEELLRGEPVDTATAGARLRYELRREHVAFLVWADGEEGGDLEAAAVAVGGPRALVVALGGGAVAGWAPPPLPGGPAAPAGLCVALGSPGEGLDGFRRSHAEAQEVRRVARLARLAGVTAYDDVAVVALLTKDEPQARAFAQRVLGDLAADDEPTRRLAQTVHAVLELQGSPRRAAQRLAVHENTVAKRLRNAERLLGRSIEERPAELLAALLVLRATRDGAISGA
ncbi:MAG TPA: helix-turn-helix domain-containing protein [Baekduia sp.]|nr:helix-turn-helix domain-containing protein [Baekduia sp.]